MINWKRVAKHFFVEKEEWKRAWEEQHSATWTIAKAVADAAGTPKFSEGYVSCIDTLRLGLQKLNVKHPAAQNRDYDRSEAEVRFEQLRRRLQDGDDLRHSHVLFMNKHKLALIKWLLK